MLQEMNSVNDVLINIYVCLLWSRHIPSWPGLRLVLYPTHHDCHTRGVGMRDISPEGGTHGVQRVGGLGGPDGCKPWRYVGQRR